MSPQRLCGRRPSGFRRGDESNLVQLGEERRNCNGVGVEGVVGQEEDGVGLEVNVSCRYGDKMPEVEGKTGRSWRFGGLATIL